MTIFLLGYQQYREEYKKKLLPNYGDHKEYYILRDSLIISAFTDVELNAIATSLLNFNTTKNSTVLQNGEIIPESTPGPDPARNEDGKSEKRQEKESSQAAESNNGDFVVSRLLDDL
jgi:hypothetical protein